MSNKRYFWLKFPRDFYNQKRIKALKRTAQGHTIIGIYIQCMLLTLDNDGVYVYEGIEPTVAAEIALEIDETVENVHIAIETFLRMGLIKELEEHSLYFSEVPQYIGSETASTIRSRKSREKKALQCNTNATLTQHRVREELEKDKELDKELYIEKEKRESNNSSSHTSSIPSINNTSESRELFESVKKYITTDEYATLVTKYGLKIVNEKIANSKKYKNCTNYQTIDKWCSQEIEKELDKMNFN